MAKPGAAGDAAAAAPFLPPQQPPPPYGIPVGGYQDPPALPYILLPLYPRRRRRTGGCPACCGSLLTSSSLLALFSAAVLLSAAAFFLWPSDPEVSLARLALGSVHVSTKHGGVSLDVDMDLTVRVYNRDFFSLDYDEIRVAIGYRGRRLGAVRADGGHVRARGVSYVRARLRLDGIRVLEDAILLIEDIARGMIPFETRTQVEGQLHLFGIDIPLEGKISCSVNVDVANQTIASQDCY